MRRLGYIALFILLLGAGLYWFAGRESTLHWALGRLTQATHGRLTFDGVHGSLLGAIEVDRVRFTSSDLAVAARHGSLRFSLLPLLAGNLAIKRLAMDSVIVDKRTSEQPLQAPQDLTLPLAVRIDAIDLKQFTLHAGTVNLTLTGLHGQLATDGTRHSIRLDHLSSPWGTASASLQLTGKKPFALNGTAQFKPADPRRVPALQLAVTGDLLAPKAVVGASAGWLSAKADAELRPFDASPLPQLTVKVERLDLRAIDAKLPQAVLNATLHARSDAEKHLLGDIALTNTVAGPVSAERLPLRTASAKFSSDLSQLKLSDLDLQLTQGAPLTGNATLTRDTLHAQLTTAGLDLSAFHTKLKPTRLAGTLVLKVQRDAQVLQAQLADRRYRYDIDASHEGNQLLVRKAVVRADSGSLEISGKMELTDAFPFAARAQLTRLDPAAFGDFPAARLNGIAEGSGWLRPAWQARVKLALADSRWRDQPLSGHVEATLTRDRVRDSTGDLSLGRNHLAFRGALGAAADRLDLDFNLARLEQITPPWRGALQGRARLAGKWHYPAATLDAKGEKIRGPQQLSVDRFTLQATVAPDLDAPLHVDLQGKGVSYGALKSDMLTLRAEGTGRQHRLTLSTLGSRLALRTRLAGGLHDQEHWSGRIEQLEITQPQPLTLEAPATLSVSRTGFDIGTANLSSNGARFHLDQFLLAPGIVRSAGTFAALPLSVVMGLAPQQPFDTTLRLSGEWRIEAAQKLNGFLRIRRESGDILFGEDQALRAQLKQASLDVTAENNQLHLESQFDSRRGSYLRAKLSAQAAKEGAAWVLPLSAPIAIDADANLLDLDWLGPLIYPSLITSGEVRATVRGDGTWGNPQLEGRVDGSNLAISEPASGVRLSQGSLKARFSQEQLVLESLEMHGKEGTLNATGQATFKGKPSLNLAFQAKQLGLLDRPNWDINADTDGTLTAENGRARLSARIKVNHARVGIPERGAPELSSDVVIKGAVAEPAEKRKSRVTLDVNVDLGDDFRVHTVEHTKVLKVPLPLYENRLDARLGGNLQIASDDAGAPIAKGMIHVVDGVYSFLGKRLDIQRGAFQFDGPINNPAVDILAMNEQFQVKVGVSVTGTARNPRVKLVSDPDVPEQEKLSWLLFGRGGQAVDTSLGGTGGAGLGIASFGTQLSDKLYLGYEQGASGTSNFVTLYSKLTKRLSVEARTGAQSSLRLFYTYELER
jgi:translocation and assembly module TamB